MIKISCICSKLFGGYIWHFTTCTDCDDDDDDDDVSVVYRFEYIAKMMIFAWGMKEKMYDQMCSVDVVSRHLLTHSRVSIC